MTTNTVENAIILDVQLEAFRATHTVKSLTSQGHLWRYISCGEGKNVLLLLEGAGADAEVEFQRILKFHNERRVISVSYPATAFAMRHLTAGVAAILDAEGVQTAAVHGHSLGAALAQCFVRECPERVSELILANIGVAGARRIKLARILSHVLSVLPGALIGPMVKSMLTRNLSLLTEPERVFYREYFSKMVGLYLTKQLIVNQFRCLIDFIDNYRLQTENLQNWGGRVLIMEAEDDRGWNASERSALKGLYPGAQVHTFSKGGHMVNMTRRDEYDTILKEFLEGTKGF
ncbi:MAG: alpha/beta hydrolase [Sedimentisphaerales bacterium]|jgi:pimeloyl-ACP methyl ester carboxylesterase